METFPKARHHLGKRSEEDVNLTDWKILFALALLVAKWRKCVREGQGEKEGEQSREMGINSGVKSKKDFFKCLDFYLGSVFKAWRQEWLLKNEIILPWIRSNCFKQKAGQPFFLRVGCINNKLFFLFTAQQLLKTRLIRTKGHLKQKKEKKKKRKLQQAMAGCSLSFTKEGDVCSLPKTWKYGGKSYLISKYNQSHSASCWAIKL